MVTWIVKNLPGFHRRISFGSQNWQLIGRYVVTDKSNYGNIKIGVEFVYCNCILLSLVHLSVYLVRVSCMNLSNNNFYRFSTYRLPHFQHLLHKRFRLVASCVEVFSCLSKHTRMRLFHTQNYSEPKQKSLIKLYQKLWVVLLCNQY